MNADNLPHKDQFVAQLKSMARKLGGQITKDLVNKAHSIINDDYTDEELATKLRTTFDVKTNREVLELLTGIKIIDI